MLNLVFDHPLLVWAKRVAVVVSLVGLMACDSATILSSDDPVTDPPTNTEPPTDTEQPTTTELSNIVDVAVEAGSFTTLVAALEATGLDTVLADETSSFTVFAPTDDAFAALGSDAISELLDDPEALSDILLLHVIPDSSVSSEDAIALDGGTVEAANGGSLAVSVQDGDLFINDSQVITPDIAASNGVIHVVDAVVMPIDPSVDSSDELVNIVDTAVAAGSFSTLVAALQATELDAVLADESTQFTVFAPTDDAFDVLGEDTINALLANPDELSNILLYHVIGGTAVDAETAVSLAGTKITSANDEEFALSLNDGNLFVNLSQVTVTDVTASNGVIHVIDTVLMPPMPLVVSGSVVDVAAADGRFNTLIAALDATSLTEVLADHGGIFTVFAPTDEAFELLGADTITALLGDLPTLSNILLTHVISGETVDSVSAFAASGGTIATASGVDVSLSISDGALFVNDARVIMTDIRAENGIIHVIDAVIQ